MGYIKDQVREQVNPSYNKLKNTLKAALGSRKSVKELIEEGTHSHYLSVEYSNQAGEDQYIIYNTEKNPIYQIKGTFLLGRHHLVVRNGNKKIGAIKKKLVVLPDIDEWHWNRHKCLIFLDEREINCVEAYKEDKQVKYKIYKHGWMASYSSTNGIYKLRKKNDIVAQLYETCHRKYVIGINDLDKELDIVLLAISLIQINNAIMND